VHRLITPNFEVRALNYLHLDSGSVGGGPVVDTIFNKFDQPPGHRTLKSFLDWFSQLGSPAPFVGRPHPDRHLLLDNVPVVFSHGDLHRDNVVVSPQDPTKVVAMIDWGSAGWLPDYWDYCKARWLAGFEGDWATRFIPEIFGRAYEDYYNSWFFFAHRLG
jgi:Phosphotransferase enzyme family